MAIYQITVSHISEVSILEEYVWIRWLDFYSFKWRGELILPSNIDGHIRLCLKRIVEDSGLENAISNKSLIPQLWNPRKMVSSGMLRRVTLVRTDVSEELSASFIRATWIGELGTTLAVTSSVRRLLVTASVVPSSSILFTLMKEEISSFETSVFIRATRRNIPEDTILHSHRRENLKSYIWNPRRQTVALLLPDFKTVCFYWAVMLRPEGLEHVKHPPTVYGALLKDHYVMDTLHFHWGLRDYRGSEHRVNGVKSVSQKAQHKFCHLNVKVSSSQSSPYSCLFEEYVGPTSLTVGVQLSFVSLCCMLTSTSNMFYIPSRRTLYFAVIWNLESYYKD
jgi:hypothetical protein